MDNIALIMAARDGHSEAVSSLLTNRASVGWFDQNSWTEALRIVACNGHTAVVNTLLVQS